MKLSSEDTVLLKNLLSVCSLAEIESIIIDDGTVRGANAEKTCAIISSSEIPRLKQKIGLTRISALRSRIDLFSGRDTQIDAKETERGEISQLEISSEKSKVQFRCTSTMLIKAPLSINDKPAFNVFINKQEVKSMLDAIRVMAAKQVILSISKGNVTIKISDESNDAFSLQLESRPSIIDDSADDGAVICYSTHVFPAIMRAASQENDITSIVIGERGTATVKIMLQDLVILPKVNEEDE